MSSGKIKIIEKMKHPQISMTVTMKVEKPVKGLCRHLILRWCDCHRHVRKLARSVEGTESCVNITREPSLKGKA